MHAFKLLELGKYEEAIESFTRALRKEPSQFIYSGRAEAHFKLKDYDAAIADLHLANGVATHTNTGYFERMGVINWLAGRENTAAGVWLDLVLATERGKLQYTDGAGGVEPGCLLWFAAVSLGRLELLVPARRLLQKKVDSQSGRNWRIENWPGPVAMFLIGLLNESQMRDRITDIPPAARECETCQAEFYVGVKALEAGQVPQARQAFRKCAALHEASAENEYDLAQREGRRRKPLSLE